MGAILPGLLMVVLIIISLVLVLGIFIFIGWLLTLFLPFSLFEGALLSMIACLVTGSLWHTILRSGTSGEEDENDFEADEIPQSQFWSAPAERTWENWFRYIIANSVYEDLLESPHWVEVMSEAHLQDLCIGLADASLEILKAKSPRSTRLRVSKGSLKHEMVKMGHPLYQEGILNPAVAAVNAILVPMEGVLRQIVREQSWDEPAGVPEVW